RQVPGGPVREDVLPLRAPDHGPGRDPVRAPVTPRGPGDWHRALPGARARLLRRPLGGRRAGPDRRAAADRGRLVGERPVRDARSLPVPPRPNLARIGHESAAAARVRSPGPAPGATRSPPRSAPLHEERWLRTRTARA